MIFERLCIMFLTKKAKVGSYIEFQQICSAVYIRMISHFTIGTVYKSKLTS